MVCTDLEKSVRFGEKYPSSLEAVSSKLLNRSDFGLYRS